ncbi:MAG: hypothetical protein CMJ20_13745 [Phycisphaeraceae bacterium]|nr:hypothetical protein [Phycisphaeraceae bacterium]
MLYRRRKTYHVLYEQEAHKAKKSYGIRLKILLASTFHPLIIDREYAWPLRATQCKNQLYLANVRIEFLGNVSWFNTLISQFIYRAGKWITGLAWLLLRTSDGCVGLPGLTYLFICVLNKVLKLDCLSIKLSPQTFGHLFDFNHEFLKIGTHATQLLVALNPFLGRSFTGLAVPP